MPWVARFLLFSYHPPALRRGAEQREAPGPASPTAQEDLTMQWETPSFQDVRFGFEVTMYINNR